MKEELLTRALSARENSYCPYSGFAVGAALLCEDGEIITGCNVENSAFSPTICAERVAIFSAISKGKHKFKKILIVGGKKGEKIESECTPCGVCRQVLSEFCDKDFEILTYDGKEVITRTLGELLPYSFDIKK